MPNIWRLGHVRDTKFGNDVSNEMLLNAAQKKNRATGFTVSELLSENQQGSEGKFTTLHPRHKIRLKRSLPN